MSYDLIIERADGESFPRAAVEAAVAARAQLRRHDAESYRSGATELVLVADRPGLPVDSLTLRIAYRGLPASFDGACDLALGLAEQLGGQVVDAQSGETVTPENKNASRARAEEAAGWAKRLGTEFEAPERKYVDEAAATGVAAGAGGDGGGRPWWKFWARD
jgi:hypothetical protein